MGDTHAEIVREVQKVSSIEPILILLQVLCEMTGIGFAAVARVTDRTWTACATHNNIHLSLIAGTQLDVNATFCIDVKLTGNAIFIDQVSEDPRYRNHPFARLHTIESFVSVPIVMTSGRYFGNLCAMDFRPNPVSNPKVVSMFKSFARLIALHLDAQLAHDVEQQSLMNERESGELREQFIAILGHDLRNPLHAVLASSDLLQRKLTDPALSDVAARIKTNARRMSTLIDDVLDFARTKLGGGLDLELQEADDVDNGLDAVVRELQDAQPERAIISNISVKRTVRCDVGRLQQLASNLLGNALTHGSARGAVNFTATDDDDDLVMQVWNDGEPIPAESMDKIFSPFWRRSTSANREGLGLGLHICSQIVRAHHGELTVTSSKENGTEFTVRLPLGGRHDHAMVPRAGIEPAT